MNTADQLTNQFKKGHKTSEFWILIVIGAAQAVAAGFDASQPLNDQLGNLTWVGVSYILGRSGLKAARATAQAKVVAASETAPVQVDVGSVEITPESGDYLGERGGMMEGYEEHLYEAAPYDEVAWDTPAYDDGSGVGDPLATQGTQP